MGRYMIVITGTGLHHNHGGNVKDADLMARDFVDDLRSAGHNIEHATFSSGHGHHNLDVSRGQHIDNLKAGITVPVSPEIARLAHMEQVTSAPPPATAPGSVAQSDPGTSPNSAASAPPSPAPSAGVSPATATQTVTGTDADPKVS